MGETAFPAAREDDHEDVHWALTTAQSLHSQGDNLEALRWVRKAVAAAVASDRDGRAIELGRLAAELEESFGAATTKRGEGARDGSAEAVEEPTMKSFAKRDFSDQPVDDLDSPTFVDSHRPDSGSPTGSDDSRARVDSEPTIVPYTKQSAGTDGPPPTAAATGQAPPARAAARTMPMSQVPSLPQSGPRSAAAPSPSSVDLSSQDTFTMPAMTLEDLQQQERQEAKGSEPAPNSTIELEDEGLETLSSNDPAGSTNWPAKEDRTMPAIGEGAVARWRVALLAASDGDARVMVLGRGDQAPEGAALAMIIPASSADAQALAALFEGKK